MLIGDLNALYYMLARGDKVASSSRKPYFVAPRTEAVELANMISSDDIPIFGSDSRDGLSPTDALLTLQAAIDRCKNDVGDRIIVLRGNHNLTTSVLFNKRGIIVETADIGFNRRSVGERFMLYGPADAPAAIISRPCVIDGLGFSGQYTGAGSNNLKIDATGGGFNGGFLSIRNCRFTTWGVSPDYALYINGMTNGEISDNVFDGVFNGYNVGAIGVGNALNQPETAFSRFERNEFRSIGETKYAFVHIAGSFPHDLIYKENILSGNATDLEGPKGHGKFLDNNGCICYGVSVLGNWIGNATDATSYDTTVAALQALGVRFSGNHYSE